MPSLYLRWGPPCSQVFCPDRYPFSPQQIVVNCFPAFLHSLFDLRRQLDPYPCSRSLRHRLSLRHFSGQTEIRSFVPSQNLCCPFLYRHPLRSRLPFRSALSFFRCPLSHHCHCLRPEVSHPVCLCLPHSFRPPPAVPPFPVLVCPGQPAVLCSPARIFPPFFLQTYPLPSSPQIF